MGLKKIWNWLRANSKNSNPSLHSSSTSWVPKENEIYYGCDFKNNTVQQQIFSKTFRIADRYLRLGNCFKSREEITEKALFKVLKKMKKFYKKNGFGLED